QAGHVPESTALISQQQISLRFLRARPEVARAVHDVTVDDRKIKVGVVVDIEESGAEADEWERWRADATRERRVLEESLAEIPEQRVRFELVIRHEQIEVAIAVVIAEVRAHAGSRPAVAGDCDTRRQRDLLERSAPL